MTFNLINQNFWDKNTLPQKSKLELVLLLSMDRLFNPFFPSTTRINACVGKEFGG